MRTTDVVTVSLPPALTEKWDKLANKRHMTRSECFRDLIRSAWEETDHAEAMADYQEAKRTGTMIKLEGSLADLLE